MAGAVVAVVAAVRDALAGLDLGEGAGSARIGAWLGALTLLVLMVGGAAMSIYSAVMYRLPPTDPYAPPPPPGTYLPLCWTVLLLPVGLAVLLVVVTAVRSRSSGMAN